MFFIFLGSLISLFKSLATEDKWHDSLALTAYFLSLCETEYCRSILVVNGFIYELSF